MFDCANGIYVDVQSYPAFSTVTIADPIDASRISSSPTIISPGGPGDIVVVRLFYQVAALRHRPRLQHREF